MTQTRALLDLSQLMGFEAATTITAVDFRDDATASRVGAKVGGQEPTAPALDNARLFGFEATAGTPDFADAAMAARVGAKVAPGEPTIEATLLDVTRLLGFETADLAAAGSRGNSIGAAVLEPNVTPEGVGISAHLGAKMGEPQITTDGFGVAPHLGAKLGEPGILSH